jgi:hypothetical protein
MRNDSPKSFLSLFSLLARVLCCANFAAAKIAQRVGGLVFFSPVHHHYFVLLGLSRLG